MTPWKILSICAVIGALIVTFAWAAEKKLTRAPAGLVQASMSVGHVGQVAPLVVCPKPPACANLMGASAGNQKAALMGFGGTKGEGVYGASGGQDFAGVYGEHSSKGPGVQGESALSNGVQGTSKSSSGAGGWFVNQSGGDHIRAGTDAANPVFQVKNNGDVFVRGTLIGQTGPQGLEGPQGPEGPEGPQGPAGQQGPAGTGVAEGVCWQAQGCSGVCSGGFTLTLTAKSPCDVSFSTGAPGCSWGGTDGYCCVCSK